MTDAEVAVALPWDALIEAIETVIVDPAAEAPARTVHTVPVPDGGEASFLLKPGWVTGDIIGVKAVTVFPDNGARDLPTVQAGFLLFDGYDGRLLGAAAADELTTRRTAAASAVAAKRLARPEASHLLVIGTGALAPMAALAHCSVRPITAVEVWGRNPAKAATLVERLAAEGCAATAVEDLDDAVGRADVITAATGATAPLIKGALLAPGTHVDLVGAFNATMRESDDDVVRRGSIFVDTRDDAMLAGDLAAPLGDGVITPYDIVADLAELVSGAHPGRTGDDEITVFKSVGLALEDLAAARLVFS